MKVEANITPAAFGSKISIDGVEQTGVRAINVAAEVGSASTVTLEYTGVDAEISGDFDKVVRFDWRERMPLRFSRPRGWCPYGAA